LSFDGPLPTASKEPLPMAVRQQHQRHILTIQPVAALPLNGVVTPAGKGRTIKP